MASAKPTAVIIEDDPPIRRFLRTGLNAQGFEVFEAETGQRGLLEASQRRPDFIILDLGLPDMDGVEVVKQLRLWTSLPILVLSARDNEQSKIEALDAGADDYLTKPFSLGELLARIRVALRRSVSLPDASARFSFGKIDLDLAQRRVTRESEEIHLTPIQYRLLTVLVNQAGKVLTHRQILNAVWGPGHAESAHYLRIYMSQLRQKLEDDPANPKHLLTESGVGYRLVT